VLIIGSDRLRDEMSRSGAQPVSDANQPCEFLVVGLDIEFTYPKISASLDALMGGATFIACNRDKRFPIEGNRFLPGCGAMVAAIEAAWGKKPDYEVGKPDTTFLEIIAAETSLQADEILVVGDSLESDIAMSNRFGSPSVFVMADSVDQPIESGAENLWPTLRLAALSDLPTLFATR
jgi:ribonucleotide monophosphatase NagD (HAD superfamily)